VPGLNERAGDEFNVRVLALLRLLRAEDGSLPEPLTFGVAVRYDLGK
jgi:hypothetical protein